MPRPIRPLISKEKAAKTALAIIDKEGLDGFQMQFVALKLKVKTPSLYHHFKNKAEMLAEVARVLLAETYSESPKHSKDWKEALLNLQISSRRAMLKHPKAAPLLLQFLPRHIMLSHYDLWIGRIGAPAELHMVIIEGLEKLTFGSVLFAAVSTSRHVPATPKLIGQTHRSLAAAIEANRFNEEELFKESVRRYLSAF